MYTCIYVYYYVYVYMYICIYIHIYIYTYIHIYINRSVQLVSYVMDKYVLGPMCICIYVYYYVYVYMYIYTYIHIYIYTYIHIYINRSVQLVSYVMDKYVLGPLNMPSGADLKAKMAWWSYCCGNWLRGALFFHFLFSF